VWIARPSVRIRIRALFKESCVIVGIGVDIVEISRLRATLDRHRDSFLRRVFTPAEQEFCAAHRDPVPHYAVRFAAKEALFKAIGTGWAKGVSWIDVEVLRSGAGAPTIVLSGEAKKFAQQLGAQTVHVSLSHAVENAIAVVILEG
jgi:holo-[acyl-carrier protein] synthase